MNLLNLPLEILRAVLRLVVADLGAIASARLFRVCRALYTETLVAFEATKVLCTSEGCRSPLHPLNLLLEQRDPDGVKIIPLLSRFLSMRPYCHEQPYYGSMSAFLNHILDKLKVEPHRRLEALVTLCTYINEHMRNGLWSTQQIGSKFILQHLDGLIMDPSVANDLDRHLLPAAIILKLPHVYEPIMQSHIDQGSEAVFDCEILGTPIYAAIKSCQPQLVPRLLAAKSVAYSPLSADSNPLHAAVSTNDTLTLQLILDDQVFHQEKIEAAIIKCMSEKNAAPIALLVSHATKHAIGVDRALEHALISACSDGDVELVSILLDQAPLTNGRFIRGAYIITRREFSLYTLDEVVSTGKEDIFRVFMDHGIRPDHLTLGTAVVSGHVGMVRAILPMVNPALLIDDSRENSRQNNRTERYRRLPSHETLWHWPSLLKSLIKHWAGDSKAVLCFLLEEARVVDIAAVFESNPRIWGGPMHAACSHGNLEAFEILVRAGMPFDKPLSQLPDMFKYRQTEHWTPIMVALTSVRGQELIVPRLLELGVKELTGYQTDAWMAFQFGYYPRTLVAFPRDGGLFFDIIEREVGDLAERMHILDQIDRWVDSRENEEDGIFRLSSKRLRIGPG